MAEQNAIEIKRQEIREEILAMKEKIPSAKIFNLFGGLFKKNSLAYWLSNIVLLNLFLITPGLVVGLIFGDLNKLLLFFTEGTMAVELVLFGMIVGHALICSNLNDISNLIVRNISDVDSLLALIDWIKKTWSTSNIAKVAVPFCFLWSFLSAGSTTLYIGDFIGFGFSIWVILVGLFAGLLLYVPFWCSLLAFKLREFKYEMNTVSPADSEIINNISEIMSKSVYTTAATTAVLTFFSTSEIINRQLRDTFSIPLVVIVWITIISSFLLIRSTLRMIANRTKWITLRRLQIKINTIESSGDLSDKDVAERLLRLVNVHKIIMESRISTFEFKPVLTLFSQLMIPLLGLLLGHFDKLTDLLNNLVKYK